jgi:hypothetical protein
MAKDRAGDVSANRPSSGTKIWTITHKKQIVKEKGCLLIWCNSVHGGDVSNVPNDKNFCFNAKVCYSRLARKSRTVRPTA